MDSEKFQIELLELYYGESKRDLNDIAQEHGVSLEECQKEWQKLLTISEKFQNLPEIEASQLSINKINVYAREKAEHLKKRPFWQAFLRPVYGLSMVLVAGVISLYVWEMHYKPSQTKVATLTTTFPLPKDPMARTVKKRLLTTPFDSTPFSQSYRLPKKKRFLNDNISSVSTGNGHSQYDMDDELDFKLSTKNLNSQDLETLFFRARKLEKLGYYKEALHDYLFIAKFYPNFENYKVIPLAVARCYENLDDKNSAIAVLQAYQKTYGKSDDIEFWIDQLKSETF